MKKVLFCSAMVTCCFIAVSAQQAITPTFKNYLKKKTIENSLPGMALTGKELYWYNLKPTGNSAIVNQALNPLEGNGVGNNLLSDKYATILADGGKVYVLPLDNMPCVVPDLSAFNMPVVKSGLGIDPKINSVPGR